jgi:hypothetical protein
MLGNSALGYNAPINLQIATSVGASALTITVETAAGGTPSGSTPVPFVFSTISGGAVTGAPAVVSLQAALSFTIASGSTMGCQSAVVCRLWIIALNNAGTVQLCAFNALSGTTVLPWNEGIEQTSQSGTGGGNNAQEYYCNASAVSGAIRALAYLEITETTAGTWTTAPSKVQLFGPGIKRPGETVQNPNNSTTSVGTFAGSILAALSSGQTVSITPQSAANVIRVIAAGTVTNTIACSGPTCQLQLARGASTPSTLIGVPVSFTVSAGANQYPISFFALDAPAVVTTLVYGFQGKISASGGGSGTYPATGSGSYLEVQEIMGALPEPANDDGGPLRMVG